MKHVQFVPDHFKEPETRDGCRDLFARSVTNVVVEISSYCNRVCTYCPVSTVDRLTANHPLSSSLYEKIVDDLAEISYSQRICLNLYNEPTSDRALLLTRIKYARNKLPNSNIYFSSNGDFLSRNYIEAMADAGLSEMYVTLHTPKGKPYDDAYVATRFCELSKRLGKVIKVNVVSPGHTMQGEVIVARIPLHVFSTNYYKYGQDRGGTMHDLTNKGFRRSGPCDRPFDNFTVSYDGTIFPCCQLFTDEPEHKSRYAIGNIADFPDIFSAYACNAMASWRRGLLRFGPKASPCDTCSEAECAGSRQEREERDHLYRHLVRPIEPGRKPRLGILGRLSDALIGRL